MGCCLPKIKYMGENDQEMEKKLEEARVIRDSQTMKRGASGDKVVKHDDQLQPVGEPEVLPPLVPALRLCRSAICGAGMAIACVVARRPNLS